MYHTFSLDPNAVEVQQQNRREVLHQRFLRIQFQALLDEIHHYYVEQKNDIRAEMLEADARLIQEFFPDCVEKTVSQVIRMLMENFQFFQDQKSASWKEKDDAYQLCINMARIICVFALPRFTGDNKETNNKFIKMFEIAEEENLDF